MDQTPLSVEERAQLKELCGERGLYLVKFHQPPLHPPASLQVRASQSSGPGSLRSYSSACGLLEAGLQDSLTLQVGGCQCGMKLWWDSLGTERLWCGTVIL